MSCDITNYAGYHVLKAEEISMLTDEQERLFWRQIAAMYERNARIAMETNIFRNDVKHAANRREPVMTYDMFRLKKPILPNRWINFREGWCSTAWGFTNADLTPYEIKKEVDKLLKEIHNPYFKKKIGTLTMPEGFTFGEEDC